IAITRNYSVIRILYVYLFIQHNQIIKEADTFVSAHSDLVTAGGLFLCVTGQAHEKRELRAPGLIISEV
ncbi:MAG: hypothetical protein IJI75_05285, partial [Solobacterium sp.]|nr:hypothetical protein [Solobacterium sp.]